jgi:glycosyltransferase involved in cell wall biosynthesis
MTFGAGWTPLGPIEDPLVEIVVPVKDEAVTLRRNVEHLVQGLTTSFPFRWIVTIADNGSTDDTADLADRLAAELGPVRVRHLELPGRGRALAAAWTASNADVVSYLDVDLSTNLSALLPLVAPLVSGHSEVAIGSRLARGARVRRQWRRELLSRTYNGLIHLMFSNGFTDAQCGFKALRVEAVAQLVPRVLDTGWFFDTELLLLAERDGLRIHEVPVDWVEDLDSRVRLGPTVRDDLRGLLRMRRRIGRLHHGHEEPPAELAATGAP